MIGLITGIVKLLTAIVLLVIAYISYKKLKPNEY